MREWDWGVGELGFGILLTEPFGMEVKENLGPTKWGRTSRITEWTLPEPPSPGPRVPHLHSSPFPRILTPFHPPSARIPNLGISSSPSVYPRMGKHKSFLKIDFFPRFCAFSPLIFPTQGIFFSMEFSPGSGAAGPELSAPRFASTSLWLGNRRRWSWKNKILMEK